MKIVNICSVNKGEINIIALEVGKDSTCDEIASKIEAWEEVKDVHFAFRDSPLRLWRDFSALNTRARCTIFFYFRQTLSPSSLSSIFSSDPKQEIGVHSVCARRPRKKCESHRLESLSFFDLARFYSFAPPEKLCGCRCGALYNLVTDDNPDCDSVEVS
jgi:hypothetical protein